MAMASRCSLLLRFLLLQLCIDSSPLFVRSEAESIGSVFFIDSATHQYIRPRSSDDAIESNAISLPQVGAAVSVLLGLPPPATLSADGSSKLNEILKPNPFDRPHAAFLVEVVGVQESAKFLESDLLNGAQKKVVFTSERANIQLPDGEVSVVSLNEVDSTVSDSITDEEIRSFASWMGGSYIRDGLEELAGELTIPLGKNARISLSMSKKADRQFIANLISLVHDFKMAIEMHEDISQSPMRPAELIKGAFHGIKVLREEYGSQSHAVEEGASLLLAVLTKMYNSLQAAYDGQIVGAIFFNNDVRSDALINVSVNSRPSARWLVEDKNSTTSAAVAEIEKLLVRRTLAWLTGIILLISTLMGIYFLLYMPFTKDTLLYSNVKLD